VSLGNLGDIRPVRGAVSELRIDHGPGYRIYVTNRGNTVVVLLAAGTKRTQDADIKLAMKIALEWKG
jgi:putative addiction module killer protein